jgi:hypothetical protein
VLLSTSIWLLSLTNRQDAPFIYGYIAFLIAHSAISLCRYSHLFPNGHIRRLYEKTLLLALVSPLPLLNTQLFLHYEYVSPALAYGFIGIAIVPFFIACCCTDWTRRDKIDAGVELLNLGSVDCLLYVSILNQNHWGCLAACMCGYKHFRLHHTARNHLIPLSTLHAYSFSLLAALMFNTVNEMALKA